MRSPRRSPLVALAGPRGVVCPRCETADGSIQRFLGLMGRRELPAGHGLLLEPAGSVHTCFMRFPIDVVFLNGELEVLGIRSALRPWRAAGRRRARAILELPAGGAAVLREGDRLIVEEAQDGA